MSIPSIPPGMSYKATIENLLDEGFMESEDPNEASTKYAETSSASQDDKEQSPNDTRYLPDGPTL